MRTEITRTYTHGFVLTEQEMRRIVQTVHDHVEKLGDAGGVRQQIEATLRDGTIIDSESADDILRLENGGQKSILKLSMTWRAVNDPPPWTIAVQYENAFVNSKSWTSIQVRVVGVSRDWAFVAASDIEERIKRTKIVSVAALLAHRLAPTLALMASLLVMVALMTTVSSSEDSGARLQAAYAAGRIHDPIQAMILLERIHNERSLLTSALLSLAMFAPVGVIALGAIVLPRLAVSYHFSWGDHQAVYQRMRTAQNVFLTVVVLGIVVGLAVNLLSRYIGI